MALRSPRATGERAPGARRLEALSQGGRLADSRDTGREFDPALRAHDRGLVLDPLVRIHRADENSSGEVSTLLAYLRELQRELDLAIVVVHHVRKSVASSQAAGQSLRGSGDLHAWSDSALYLRPKNGVVTVTVEHRSARPPSPFAIRLSGEPPALELAATTSDVGANDRSLGERVLAELASASTAMTRAALRDSLSVRNERLGAALGELLDSGLIERCDRGWVLRDSKHKRSPFPPIGMNGNGTVDDFDDGPPDIDDPYPEDEIPF